MIAFSFLEILMFASLARTRSFGISLSCAALYLSFSTAALAQAEKAEDSEELSAPQVEKKAPKNENGVTGEKSLKSDTSTKKPAAQRSLFLPDWQTHKFTLGLRPVLGFQYSSNTKSKEKILQGELGLYGSAQGIDVISGNPGFQIEPGFGYAVGTSAYQKAETKEQTGTYRRIWGGLKVPIYYRYVRQTLGVEYGVVRGGPIPESRRFELVSDTAIALVPHVSAHYTLTYERAFGADANAPVLHSYDHWLHGRFSASLLNFFADAGPGYSKSSLSSASVSETYLLALSGFDLFTDKIGFDAQAKYVIAASSDDDLEVGSVRSPLEDLGSDTRRVGLPEDSFHASAFFGLRKVFAGVGVGWRYTLEILNMNERNNTKKQKTESNGLGIYASFNF